MTCDRSWKSVTSWTLPPPAVEAKGANAFGFMSPEALIAVAMLSLGGHRPSLPGRAAHG